MVQFFRECALQRSSGRDPGARNERRMPIDRGAFRVVQHLRRDRPPAIGLPEFGEALDDVHSSLSRARCGARSRWANQTSVAARFATWVVELKSECSSYTLSGIPDKASALGRVVDSVSE